MQFSAGIVILCEVFRYSHIIRELPGITGSAGVEPAVLFLPLWVCFTSTVIPSDGSLHFSALLISWIAHIHLRPAPQAMLIKMHTPEIASAFQPQELQSIAISCDSFSLKDVC